MTKSSTTYTVKAKVFVWPGQSAAWRFVPVPKKETALIRAKFGGHARGFGSLPVTATINKISWQTSIFYDGRSETYLLPLKAQVRKKAGIDDDDTVTCVLQIRI